VTSSIFLAFKYSNLEVTVNYKCAPGTFDHCWKILMIFRFVNALMPLRDSVDRKLDFLVDELARYGIAVAGIQEIKWFWLDVWSAAKG